MKFTVRQCREGCKTLDEPNKGTVQLSTVLVQSKKRKEEHGNTRQCGAWYSTGLDCTGTVQVK